MKIQRIFGKEFVERTTKKSRISRLSSTNSPLSKATTILLNASIVVRVTQRLIIYYSSPPPFPPPLPLFLPSTVEFFKLASPRPTPLFPLLVQPPLGTSVSHDAHAHTIHIEGGREGGFGMTSPRGGNAGRERGWWWRGGSRGCAGVNDRPRLEVRGVQCMKPSVIATLLQSDLQG